ncbi:anti-phage protein KwaA [Cohnella hongkongensis]|uniref:Anti-phage protein KwaA n=1 Tax=Cohnella hongkongensis TaxID=178337 RepID=A0ABV9F7N6_9BACL
MENNQDNIRMKVRFYIMSLWLLFVLIFLLTVDIPFSFETDAKFVGIVPLLKRNVLPLIAAILSIVSWLLTQKTKYEWAGVTNPPYTIVSIKNENYEYLTFLTTYIIPLICIDLSNVRFILVLGILLILIGSIFVKMDLYYGNPTLALLGYRLYRAEIQGLNDPNGIILISKDRLSRGTAIEWIKIENNVWVARENRR